MPPRKKTEIVEAPAERATKRVQPPAMNPDAREKQLTKLAYDLAERQLRDGSASPSVISHFLKIASKREVLEQEILEKQKTLIEAKADSMSKDREAEELAKQAINAMRKYRPSED